MVFLSFLLEILLSFINFFNFNGGIGDVMVKFIVFKILLGLVFFIIILIRVIVEIKLVFVFIILCFM